MRTPFEQGKIDGQWTLEQVYQCGFSTPLECLEHQERVYQRELTELVRLPTAYATQHAEYLEGLISATRATLRALM